MQNVELVQSIYGAIADGQMPEVLSRMQEDVVVEVPGPAEIPFAGTFRGHDGVIQFFTALATNAEMVAFEPQQFIADGDDVVVLGHEHLTAKPTSRSWQTDWAMVWTVADGRVSRLREYHQTAAIADAYR